MINSPALPICLVIGRNDLVFVQLTKRLGSKAIFIRGTERDSATEVMTGNVDVVVILWSHNSRLCALQLHRQMPGLKIILEQNKTSLGGVGEKNGFMSVIEQSQGQSELITQLEAAFDDWQSDLQSDPRPESLFDPQAVIERLGSVPLARKNTQQMADYLLDLLLSATKSGAGALFVRSGPIADFVAYSQRSLPYGVNSLRVGGTSKFCSLLSTQKLPVEVGKESSRSPLRRMAEQVGCDVILPVRIDGELKAWFMLFVGHGLTHSDKSTLGSLGFFAAEMLKEAESRSRVCARIERDALILTKVSDALAWIKPNGDLEVIHDANGLIALRRNVTHGSYRRLSSSRLKIAIDSALKGRIIDLRFKKGAITMVGELHELHDKSLLLHLKILNQSNPETIETKRQTILWQKLAGQSLGNPDLNEGLSALQLGNPPTMLDGILRIVQAPEGELHHVEKILREAKLLFPRVDISSDLTRLSDQGIGSTTASSILFLLLAACLRQSSHKTRLNLSCQLVHPKQLTIQFDFEGWIASESAMGDALEALARGGIAISDGLLTFFPSSFGVRWEVRCATLFMPHIAGSEVEPVTNGKAPLAATQPNLNAAHVLKKIVRPQTEIPNEREAKNDSDLCSVRESRPRLLPGSSEDYNQGTNKLERQRCSGGAKSPESAPAR